MNRRLFLSFFAAPFLLALGPRRAVTEIAEASAHFGPYFLAELVPGSRLDVILRRGHRYVAWRGRIVGRLDHGHDITSVSVETVAHDEHGRLRLFARLEPVA
jgi:hypothetical protein